MTKSHIAVLLTLTALTALSFTGCGGGGTAGPSGSMSFAVNFPPLPTGDKVLPNALNSIVIDILDDTQESKPAKVSPVVLNRPSPTGGQVRTTVPNVGIGPTLIKARGYDGENGTGQLIIIASATCEVLLNDTVQVTLTMGTTTTTIILTGPASVLVGAEATLRASATDVNGDPITNPDLDWSSSNESILTVTPDDIAPAGSKNGYSKTATVTGIARGTATVTVEDKVSGAQVTTDIDVNPNISSVTVDPDQVTVNQDKTAALTAAAFSGSTEITNVDFSFESEDEEVATVTENALDKTKATVTGVAEGETRIKVTQPYTTASAYCQVRVTATGDIDIVIE